MVFINTVCVYSIYSYKYNFYYEILYNVRTYPYLNFKILVFRFNLYMITLCDFVIYTHIIPVSSCRHLSKYICDNYGSWKYQHDDEYANHQYTHNAAQRSQTWPRCIDVRHVSIQYSIMLDFSIYKWLLFYKFSNSTDSLQDLIVNCLQF